MKFLSVAVVSSLLAALSVSATSCSSSQFEHNSPRTGSCCLPHGGPSNPPKPPPTKECPGDYYWHTNFECCVPKAPSHPTTPSCPSGPWDHQSQCCNKPTPPSNPSQPSGKPYHNKRSQFKDTSAARIAARNWRSKVLSCPAGQTICNVSADLTSSNTYACVNTKTDINFCGGCGARADDGADCSAIPNAWNTACNAGECQVLTCENGFRVSHNGRKCIAMD